MRRFIAYLTLAAAGVATIAATFSSTFVKAERNIEYDDGRALVFRVDIPTDHAYEPDNTPAMEMAETMQGRLETFGVTNYDIVTVGDDTLKVIFREGNDKISEDGADKYDDIGRYLTFNGEFAIGTETDEFAVGSEFLDTSKDCYVEYREHYPTVVIPIKKDSADWKRVVAEAERLKEETPESQNPEEPTPKTLLHLVYNFDEEGGDKISDIINTEEHPNLYKNKYLMSFAIDEMYLDAEKKDAIAATANLATGPEQQITPEAVKEGTYNAKFHVMLLNSEKLKYDVNFVDKYRVPAYFENLVVRKNVSWSRTLIATLFAVLILSLLLAVFYRWGAVAVGSLSIASTFLAILFLVLFSIEFNTAAIVGLCGVALASIASGIIYLTKVKEEAYRGRTLKKANAEGAKRALLPIVDVNVALIIIGACVYWLGGPMMASFAGVTVLGGIVSLILNTLGLKGMMWLLTNTTKFQGNYTVIGVENNKVPNILNDEKQEYYGPYQNSNPTKHKKVFSIVAAVLFVASLAGTITFGALNNGVIFNDAGREIENSYLYVETNNVNATTDDEYINALMDRSAVKAAEDEFLDLKYEIQDLTQVDDSKASVDYKYYKILTFQEKYTGEEEIVIFATKEAKAAKDLTGSTTAALKDVFENELGGLAGVDSVSFKVGTLISAQQPDYTKIIIGVSVGLSFVALYLILRYGISRGFVMLLINTFTGFITAGIFCLTRAVVGLNLFIMLPVIAFFAVAISVMFMNKEKELILDDKVRNKDNKSVENRKEIMLRSTALALGPILTFTAIAIYLMTNFFGFGAAGSANIFMFGLVGVIIAAVLVAILYGPTAHVIYSLFSKIKFKKPENKKPRKKKKVVKSKSAEPEEAIFIGIND